MMQKKKILLITPMLHQGGFERICAMTARLLSDMYEVHIVVFSREDMFYDVSGIDLIDLELPARNGKLSKIANIIKRVAKLRALKKSLGIDISYSFGTTANIVNVLSKVHDVTWVGIRGYGAIHDRGMGLVCRLADLVVCCTRTMERDISDKFSPKKTATLYNPCDVQRIEALSKESYDEKYDAFLNQEGKLIASMAREDDVKQFWHLLKSVRLLKEKGKDARLMIIGDGEFSEYKKLAEKLGIGDAVLFTGALTNPFPLLRQADLYALTSESEGFPNALVEAMACGVPCISVNCMTGPAEIMHRDYEACEDSHKKYMCDYGMLMPVLEREKDMNPEVFTEGEYEFARGMEEVLDMDAIELRCRAKKRAREFSVEAYVNTLEQMIET